MALGAWNCFAVPCRAMSEAHVAVGDMVILPRISSEPITYTVAAKSEKGLIVSPSHGLSEPGLVSRRHLEGMRRISRTNPARREHAWASAKRLPA